MIHQAKSLNFDSKRHAQATSTESLAVADVHLTIRMAAARSLDTTASLKNTNINA
jgi:hypothetical protein